MKPGSGTTSSESAGEPPRAGAGRKSIAVFCGLLPPSRPGSATAPGDAGESRSGNDDGSSAAACPFPRPGSGTAPPVLGFRAAFGAPAFWAAGFAPACPGRGTTGLTPGLVASAFGRWTVKGFLHFGHLMLSPEGGTRASSSSYAAEQFGQEIFTRRRPPRTRSAA